MAVLNGFHPAHRTTFPLNGEKDLIGALRPREGEAARHRAGEGR